MVNSLEELRVLSLLAFCFEFSADNRNPRFVTKVITLSISSFTGYDKKLKPIRLKFMFLFFCIKLLIRLKQKQPCHNSTWLKYTMFHTGSQCVANLGSCTLVGLVAIELLLFKTLYAIGCFKCNKIQQEKSMWKSLTSNVKEKERQTERNTQLKCS